MAAKEEYSNPCINEQEDCPNCHELTSTECIVEEDAMSSIHLPSGSRLNTILKHLDKKLREFAIKFTKLIYNTTPIWDTGISIFTYSETECSTPLEMKIPLFLNGKECFEYNIDNTQFYTDEDAYVLFFNHSHCGGTFIAPDDTIQITEISGIVITPPIIIKTPTQASFTFDNTTLQTILANINYLTASTFTDIVTDNTLTVNNDVGLGLIPAANASATFLSDLTFTYEVYDVSLVLKETVVENILARPVTGFGIQNTAVNSFSTSSVMGETTFYDASNIEITDQTEIDNLIQLILDKEVIPVCCPDCGAEADSGIWSIADSLGTRTYYPTVTDALIASVPYDTIHLHANVEETSVTVTLVDTVSINFNGFSYSYTNPDTSNAFTDNGNQVRTHLFDGLIYRSGSPLGDETNTACINMLSNTSKLFSRNTKYLSTETWAVILSCYAEGVIAQGEYGGIALSGYVEIKDCIGKGNKLSGIKVFDSVGKGSMYDCKGYSSGGEQQQAGIYSADADLEVSNCFGYCANLGDGVFLGNCTSTSITGISEKGSGVVISGRNCTSITGKTSSYQAQILGPIAGVVLNDVEIATNINGISEGQGNPGIAIGQYQSGFFSIPSVVLNANGKGRDIGCSIYQTLGADGTANKLMIQNSSFHAENFSGAVACTIEKNQNFGNRINILNSSFTTSGDNAIGIEGIGVTAQVRYSNCSFAFGHDSVGLNPATVNVTQLIANTQDNQGNILL